MSEANSAKQPGWRQTAIGGRNRFLKRGICLLKLVPEHRWGFSLSEQDYEKLLFLNKVKIELDAVKPELSSVS